MHGTQTPIYLFKHNSSTVPHHQKNPSLGNEKKKQTSLKMKHYLTKEFLWTINLQPGIQQHYGMEEGGFKEMKLRRKTRWCHGMREHQKLCNKLAGEAIWFVLKAASPDQSEIQTPLRLQWRLSIGGGSGRRKNRRKKREVFGPRESARHWTRGFWKTAIWKQMQLVVCSLFAIFPPSKAHRTFLARRRSYKESHPRLAPLRRPQRWWRTFAVSSCCWWLNKKFD